MAMSLDETLTFEVRPLKMRVSEQFEGMNRQAEPEIVEDKTIVEEQQMVKTVLEEFPEHPSDDHTLVIRGI